MQERLVQQMMQAFGTFSGVITNAMLSTAQAMVHMKRAILRVSYLTGNVTEATQLVLSHFVPFPGHFFLICDVFYRSTCESKFMSNHITHAHLRFQYRRHTIFWLRVLWPLCAEIMSLSSYGGK